MFAKLLAVILFVGASACVLLAARHARIQAAHDLAEARLRIVHRDRELWALRARIATRVTPERVQRLASGLTPLRPIVPHLRPGTGETRVARARTPSVP